MTTLATRENGNGLALVPAKARAAEAGAMMSIDDVWVMAERVAASKLFAVRTADEAFALMMICQAEGIHPMLAVRRFHVIQGRPAMRSDAVQGEMQARGWVITPLRRTRDEARAIFAHPSKCPNGFELGVAFEQYKAAGLTGKDTWKNYPDDMLWARLATKACRTLDPGIIAGIYSPEEVDDMAHLESPAARHAVAAIEATETIRNADGIVPGQPPGQVDNRRYKSVAEEAAVACGLDPNDLHRHLALQSIALGRLEPPAPPSIGKAVAALNGVYQLHREWLRSEIASWCLGAAVTPEVIEVGPEPEVRPRPVIEVDRPERGPDEDN